MARELALALMLAACSREHAPLPAGTPLAAKSFYRIDPAPQPPCTAGATCEARLVLTALGDYHINPQYPFKFVGEPGVEIDGTGTFSRDTAKTGTLTIRFRAKSGVTKLVGTFKLSVCTDETCEIETPKIELDVSAPAQAG